MSAPKRPVLRYHGGKFRIAQWVIGHFPPHRVYVEPFGGAASVLMQKPRTAGEVYNDIDDQVVNVFRILRDPATAAELERRVRLTPFSRTEYVAAYEHTDDPLERARRTLVKAFMGFGSDALHRNGPRGMRSTLSTHAPGAGRPFGNSGFRTSARDLPPAREMGSTGFRTKPQKRETPNGATPAKDWATWPDAIPAFVERLRGVVVECRPALEVIELHDRVDTLFYVDPPYPKSTRGSADRNGYRYEMKDDDHRKLAEVLHGVGSMVVVSGYACDLYDAELYPDWLRTQRSALADGARERTEVLWLNPAAAERLRQAQGTLAL